MRRAVSGPSTCHGFDKRSEEIERLMLELERWSMELQRSCPEDWNQCSSIVVRSLDEIQNAERKGKFHV